MVLSKGDFIEIEFTAKTKNGEVFDSNIKKDLESAGLETKAKPFIFSLGEGMFLKGVEDFLIGKELGEYNIELSPEKAFGLRNPKLIQMLPIKVFVQQKLNPIPGVLFNFDGKVAKVLTVSGGRVMVDFNNPLAGKDVEYKVKILRKVDDINEKVKSLINFLFQKDLKFEIKDKKLIIESGKGTTKFIELFKGKFKDILRLDLEVKEIQEHKDNPKD